MQPLSGRKPGLKSGGMGSNLCLDYAELMTRTVNENWH